VNDSLISHYIAPLVKNQTSQISTSISSLLSQSMVTHTKVRQSPTDSHFNAAYDDKETSFGEIL